VSAVTQPVAAVERRLPMHRKRKRINAIALVLSLAAMAFGLFWLIWILFEVIYLGVSQCHRRLGRDGAAGHAAGHADRHLRRDLSG
jgi:hypothetical protein